MRQLRRRTAAAGLATGQPESNNGSGAVPNPVDRIRRRFARAPHEPATRTTPMNSYASLCDDFGVSTYLHGKLEMPSSRETVLHFFEAVQKAAPKMSEFDKRG